MSTRQELLDELGQLDFDAATIKEQLSAARRDHAINGVYSDPVWYGRAEHALKVVSTKRRTIQAKLTKLREETAERNRAASQGAVRGKHLRFLHAFFRRAKARLPEETFTAIVRSTHEALDIEHPDATDCDMCIEPRETS